LGDFSRKKLVMALRAVFADLQGFLRGVLEIAVVAVVIFVVFGGAKLG
jgi:hypothetical protein